MKNFNNLLKSFIALALVFSFSQLSAQDDTDIPFDDLPPTSEYGKCYAKCKIPDVYETVTVKKLRKEASSRLIKVPAEYKTVTEQMLIKEARKEFRMVPATYKTATEQILVEPEKKVIKTIPAVYKTETEQILVSPARGKWVRKKKDPSCFSQNPDDCYVACYEEIPAIYRTESRQVLVEPAKTVEDVIPAVYKTVTKQVIDNPARVEEIDIPAEYTTISKKVLVSPESTRSEEIPAQYQDIAERKLVKKGGYTVWTEILCADKTTNDKIYRIQRVLKEAGYDPGPIDGVLGVQTQAALKQYQTDKGLPVGNLNMETLKAMGVE